MALIPRLEIGQMGCVRRPGCWALPETVENRWPDELDIDLDTKLNTKLATELTVELALDNTCNEITNFTLFLLCFASVASAGISAKLAW